MKVEAITVCIDFSKKLEKCISNKHLFDRWIIVTHESDQDTINLCKKNKIEFVCSKRVFDNAEFAKGRAINEGLNICDKDAWLVHLDADVKLSHDFRKTIQKNCNNKSALYGMPRYYGDKLLKTPVFRNKIVNKKTKSILELIVGDLGPIGYFQMWHSSTTKFYSEISSTGDVDDIQFMLSFKPQRPKTNFKENWITLPMHCEDVSGFQGHYRKHYLGMRNIKKTSIHKNIQSHLQITDEAESAR